MSPKDNKPEPDDSNEDAPESEETLVKAGDMATIVGKPKGDTEKGENETNPADPPASENRDNDDKPREPDNVTVGSAGDEGGGALVSVAADLQTRTGAEDQTLLPQQPASDARPPEPDAKTPDPDAPGAAATAGAPRPLSSLAEAPPETPEDQATANQASDHTLIVDTPSSSDAIIATIIPQISGVDAGAIDDDDAAGIDRFRFIKMLGRGAFGEVHLADDPRLKRKVAIKLALAGNFDTDAERETFFREARSAAHLRHPHIVTVYEVGQFEDKSYIVHDFVEGRTLGRILKDGKPSRGGTVRMVRLIALALHYAHEQGVVHRDMKPENVLVDAAGEPHIADFGLARRDDEFKKSQKGALMGTPAYMSPEQARGDGWNADGRTDIWSLGVMFYEMLVGNRPFRGKKATQVIEYVKDKTIVPPREVDPTVPLDLEVVCMKCLERDPEKRFATGKELADELGRWERGEPILSRKINVWARTALFAKRNPLVASLIAAVCVTLALGTTVSLIQRNEAVQARNVAEDKTDALIDSQNKRAIDHVKSLETTQSVTYLIRSLARSEVDVVDQLRATLDSTADPAVQSRMRMALLKLSTESALDEKMDETLFNDLLEKSQADEFAPHRESLLPHLNEDRIKTLWTVCGNKRESADKRFRAACTLAAVTAGDEYDAQWQEIADDTTSQLLGQDLLELPRWLDAIKPVSRHLREHIRTAMLAKDPVLLQAVANSAAKLYRDDVSFLVDLIAIAEPSQHLALARALAANRASSIHELTNRLAIPFNRQEYPSESVYQKKEEDALFKANWAMALLDLQHKESVLPLLNAQDDEEIRSRIVNGAGRSQVPHGLFRELLDSDQPDRVAAAAIALGEYPTAAILPQERKEIRDQKLQPLYNSHQDAGVHSAVAWLLRKWGFENEQHLWDDEMDHGLQPDRDWFVNSMQNTLSIIRPPKQVLLGSPKDEPYRYDAEKNNTIDAERQRLWEIPRTFAVATREVTRAEFDEFMKDMQQQVKDGKLILFPGAPVNTSQYEEFSPYPQSPATNVRWFHAAAYCRWLSEKEGIPEDQMVYPPLSKIGISMKLAPDTDILARTGYRLPTANEWEYACRGGTTTSRYYGDTDQLLTEYAWYLTNAQDQSQLVGQLKPNNFGLFDMYGNVQEWCHTWYFDDQYDGPRDPDLGALPKGCSLPNKRIRILTDGHDCRPGGVREFRGGSYNNLVSEQRSAFRDPRASQPPGFFQTNLGFRIARTIKAHTAPTPNPEADGANQSE